jgi:hypothetical protein
MPVAGRHGLEMHGCAGGFVRNKVRENGFEQRYEETCSR